MAETEKDCQFAAELSCGYLFRNLVDCLSSFSTSGIFIFDSTGFRYNYSDGTHTNMFIRFPRENLVTYFYTGDEEKVFGLNMSDFFRRISLVRVGNAIRLSTQPHFKGKLFIQIGGPNEDMNNGGYVTPRYYAADSDRKLPQPESYPDRTIPHYSFVHLGDLMKTVKSDRIYITSVRMKNQTRLEFQSNVEDGQAGGVHNFSNFIEDEDDTVLEEANVLVDKTRFERLTRSSKFAKDGIVKVWVVHEKYLLLWISCGFLGYLEICMKDIRNQS